MSEQNGGVVYTLREMFDQLQRVSLEVNDLAAIVKSDIDSRGKSDLENRVRKIEQQNAAHWVVHTLFVGVIAFALERLFT